MTIIDNFSSIEGNSYIDLFRQENVPVFQNKTYLDKEDAKRAPLGNVDLVQSKDSGFVFNRSFDPALMNYDANYQNEQANSSFFRQHMQDVYRMLKDFGIEDKKVVEIGCGKGVFFNIMLENNIDCIGFDPTYEGDNPRIIKEYFSEGNNINADVIIMRHTLEHIPNPFTFLHTIANANNNKGMIFIEVPTFDWILEKKAFWDIFYEHCNYFTEGSLGKMFSDAETGSFFGGQYIYLWADLSNLKSTIDTGEVRKVDGLNFDDQVRWYRSFLHERPSIAIWGAGAKGSTFLNLLDPGNTKVKYVIDINPLKQGRFIAHTGHPIYSPEILERDPVDNILVMNENYMNEIAGMVDNNNIEFSKL